MSEPAYELVFRGDRWEAVRGDGEVFETWPRDSQPYGSGNDGMLVELSFVVQERWGRLPEWQLTNRGWKAA